METMAEASASISGTLHGLLAGLIMGIVIAVVCRDKRIGAIWISVSTTAAAFVSIIIIQGVWTLQSEKLVITTATYLKYTYWSVFALSLFVVIVSIQWFVWLLQVVALIYWRRKNTNSSL